MNMTDIVSMNGDAVLNKSADFRDEMRKLRELALAVSADRLAIWLGERLEQATGKNNLFDLVDKNDFTLSILFAGFFICQNHAAEVGAKIGRAPDARNPLDYIAYHVMIGSTPFETATKMDFPGEDSLKAFLERVLKDEEPALAPEALLRSDMTMMGRVLKKSPDIYALCSAYLPEDVKAAAYPLAEFPSPPKRRSGYRRSARMPDAPVDLHHP